MKNSHSPVHTGKDNALKASMHDGISHAVMLGAGESYLGAFGIFLKATTLQIGLLAALPLVFEAIAQWISALTLDRFRSRRTVIFFWILFQAVLWLPMALLPFLFEQGTVAAVSLICLAILSHVATGCIHPVWSSLMGDLVPPGNRGRFFGNRNRFTGMSSFISLLIAGSVLHFFKRAEFAALGFLAVFIVAMLARLHSAFWIRRYEDPPYHVHPEDVFSFWQFLRRAPRSNFAKFTFFFAMVNFSVSFSSPYFALYMLRDLQFSYLEFTIVSGTATLFQFLTFRYWGEISDRFGNKKILNVCSWGIAIVPVCWLFSSNIFYICSIQIYGGMVWAGFNLAAANFIYDACSPPKRARCVAYRGVINSVFVLAGSMSGGFVAKQLPADFFIGPLHFAYPLLFIFFVSGILRLLSAAFFLKIFHEVREVEPIRSRELVFRITHIKPIAGATFNLMTYFFRDQKLESEKKISPPPPVS
ncbi:MAG: MFS transporter [Proteobacteria bacterium]|nr:MFS transporter [Pseudomonadota bacterium]MBU1737529.1 MFS transporter [Pseudomonadota bacterium]